MVSFGALAERLPLPENMDDRLQRAAERLWTWFSDNAKKIASELDETSDDGLPPVLRALDSQVSELGDGIEWEIGPHEGQLYLAISPGGDAALYELTQEIAALAKPPRGWVVLPAKPPKDWNRSLSFAGQNVDAGRFSYRLSQQDDGSLSIVWELPEDYELSPEDREALGWVVLESELGEATVIEHFATVEVSIVETWPDDVEGRAIHQLWADVQRCVGSRAAAPRRIR